MKLWIKKNDDNEPLEQISVTGPEIEPKQGWQRVFGGAILCAMLVLGAVTIYGYANGKFQEKFPTDAMLPKTESGAVLTEAEAEVKQANIVVRTSSDSGRGYLIENQNYSFERLNDSQSCALVHFVYADTGETAMEDFMVFFSKGDNIEITYPQLNGYQTLSPGCWSWDAFELTVKYYKPEDVHIQAPSATYVGTDNICTDKQPDGYPV